MGPGDGPRSDLRDAVLDWWPTVRERRDELPWRATRDPWSVLVAETMLAQTQVERVAIRYREFLARFPHALALADASAADVIRAWSGLGYYRRGTNLQAAARVLVERHGGDVPASLEELLALPGVGPYTARAVLAFAFGERVGPVDTNIARVLARAAAGEVLSRAKMQALADDLVAASDCARDWNLALMDLGSLVCRARAPRCDLCPAFSCCAWRRRAADVEDPARRSAGTSRPQARFSGSDREGRGRLLRALCEAPLARDAVPEVAGWPEDEARAARVLLAMIADGLVVASASSISLP